MKLVKQRGLWSPQGRKKAQALDAVSAPYLKSRNGDGSITKKAGPFLSSYKSAEPPLEQDGFYSMGYVDGKYVLVGSSDARGKFVFRGVPGTQSFVVVSLGFFGRGLGSVSELEVVGSSTTFDGRLATVYRADLYTTSNGKSVNLRYTQNFISFPEQMGIAVSYAAGRTMLFAGQPTFQTGMAFVRTNGAGQLLPSYLVEVSGTKTVSTLNYDVGQLNGRPDVEHFSPSDLVAIVPTMLPSYSPTSISTAATPGLRFHKSSDGGRTWTYTSDMDAVFATELAQLRSVLLPSAPTLFGRWNNAVLSAAVRAYSPTPASWVFVAVVPYAENVGGSLLAKGKVKVGVREVATGAFIPTLTLFDGDIDDAFIFASAGGIEFHYNGLPGVLLFTRPTSVNRINEPRQIVWTDGYTAVPLGPMPYANKHTGGVTAVSRRELICPMYDGQHSLYSSRDGIVWRRRATIFEGGPVPADRLVLDNFAQVTFLRDAGRPALLTPEAPWASDYRKGAA